MADKVYYDESCYVCSLEINAVRKRGEACGIEFIDISSEDFEITKMSGGQRQRLAFIRAIITKYSILFADEPTGNLDWLNARILMDFLLKELKDNKSSAIIVSHDIDLAIEYADKIVYIEKKKTVIKKENLNDEDFFFGRISNETIYKKSKGIWSCHSKNHDDKSLKELIAIKIS